MTTSDTSLPRTQALALALVTRLGICERTRASCSSASIEALALAGASADARARDRVAATRVWDPSGSRMPPSQQRRLMPSTTALDQSSIEPGEGFFVRPIRIRGFEKVHMKN